MNDIKKIALIPSYEPNETLIEVLHSVSDRGFEVVVVDDGSGEAYKGLFEKANAFGAVLSHEQNRGKGAALKTGLSYISEHFDGNYIIVTLDSDGQHSGTDAFRAAMEAESSPSALILGSRRLGKAAPIKSRLGNFLTRTVFGISTGLHIYDTQTGLRAFDSSRIPEMLSIGGDRYEYEMNVLLYFAKEKLPVREIEISTIYIDNNSGTHFNPFKDSLRIFKEILKFSASSFLCFLIDYGLYSLFLLLTAGLGTLAVPVSNIAARIFSACVNYNINRRFVFKSKKGTLKSALEYFALAATILAVNTAALELFVNCLGTDKYVTKLIIETAMFIVSWLVQRIIVFKKKETKAGK